MGGRIGRPVEVVSILTGVLIKFRSDAWDRVGESPPKLCNNVAAACFLPFFFFFWYRSWSFRSFFGFDFVDFLFSLPFATVSIAFFYPRFIRTHIRCGLR